VYSCLDAVTFAVVAAGTHPAGFHPAGGFRRMNAPIMVATK
jgi:hypothetical protein